MKGVKGFLKKHEMYEGSSKLHEMCEWGGLVIERYNPTNSRQSRVAKNCV